MAAPDEHPDLDELTASVPHMGFQRACLNCGVEYMEHTRTLDTYCGPECKTSHMQRCSGAAVQRCSGAAVQRCSGAAVQSRTKRKRPDNPDGDDHPNARGYFREGSPLKVKASGKKKTFVKQVIHKAKKPPPMMKLWVDPRVVSSGHENW